ncbi:MAG: efflux RND transporter periplasmic adaptor subunit [Cyanobacteria bacterium P01_E01_bin.6]
MVQIRQAGTSRHDKKSSQASFPSIVIVLATLGLTVGCSGESSSAERSPTRPDSQAAAVVVVDVAIAQAATASDVVTYTGTTEPVQTVSLRSQTEGQLLSLTADVGDLVQAGTALGQLDADLLRTAVVDAEAELSAREFLVIQAEAEVSDGQAQVALAIAELQQAQADAARLQSLAADGAIAEQLAEQAQTAVRTAEQAVRSAEQVVRTREQSIAAAERRVESQQAILTQTRERLSHATITSPITGTVMERFADPGDLIQPGQDVLQLGDLSEIHVLVQVADRDRSKIQVGQPADIQFDAFPTEIFSGRVTRISPVADAAARLIPIEITLTNPEQRISSGLIARVDFVAPLSQQTITVPESALTVGDTEPAPDEAMLFVLAENGDQPTAQSRPVTVGDRRNGHVEILTGLEPGESYILRANQPLTSGQSIQPSLLSTP